jgi:hypothetical protein
MASTNGLDVVAARDAFEAGEDDLGENRGGAEVFKGRVPLIEPRGKSSTGRD